MNVTKTVFLTLGIFLCPLIVLAQDEVPETDIILEKTTKKHPNSFGITLKGSTNGVGADVAYQFHKKMGLRIGYDTFTYSFTSNYSSGEVDLALNADVEAGTLGLFFDYYLGRKFFISAGIVSNNFYSQARGSAVDDYLWGDILISKEDFGSLDVSVQPGSEIAPYLGLGFGRILSQRKTISMSLELGMLYFGEPDLTIDATGALSPTADPNNNQEAILENEISEFVFYPVIKLNLGIKLTRNK